MGIGDLPALLLIAAGVCGVVPRFGGAAWPFVIVAGVVWFLI
jgi:putative exporter of polyketide antibiotics